MKSVFSAIILLVAFFLVGCPNPDPDPDPGAECPIGQVYLFDACRESCVAGACGTGEVCYEPSGACAPPSPCLYVDCPSGESCVAGQCFATCSSDADCADGFCAQGGYCNDDPCDDINCPQGQECRGDSCHPTCSGDADCPTGETCRDGVCSEDPCDVIVCPANHLCFEGACYPGCLSDDDCAAGVSCVDNACVDPCANAACGADQVCVEGDCFDTCAADDDCMNGELCRDGRCTTDACLGVQCPGDDVCYEGSCYPFCVDNGDCTPPNLCYDSRCAVDECAGVQCPAGTVCNLGTCKPTCDGGCPLNTSCYADSFCDAEDLCDDHPCPIGQVCYQGSCYDYCIDNGECTPPEICWENRCAADPCDGVFCPIGEVCYAGSCYLPCTDDDVCDPQSECWDGRCAPSPCEGVQCPIGQQCLEGACYEVCVDDGDCTPPDGCFLGLCLNHPCADGTCVAPDTCGCPTLEPSARNVAVPDGEFLMHFAFDAQESELITLKVGSTTTAGTIRFWSSDMVLQGKERFTTTENAWIPARIPKTDTYRVTVEVETAGEDFSLSFQRYGLETPVAPPGFVGTTTTSDANESFLFFAEDGRAIAADAVPTSGDGGGTAYLELLTPDGLWEADLGNRPVGHPTFGSWNQGRAVAMSVYAPERGIYRVRIVRNFGVDPLGVRIGVLHENETPVVDTDMTGCVAGTPTIFPRLAFYLSNDVVVCPGTHLEYGTIIPTTSGMTLTGQAAGAIIEQAEEVPRTTPLVLLEDSSNAVVSGLEFKRPVSAASPTFDVRGASTNITLSDLTVDMGTTQFSSQNSLVTTEAGADGFTIDNVTLVGAGDIGTIRGDDVVVTDSSFGGISTARIGILTIIGDRASVEDNEFGTINSSTSFLGGPTITGNDAALRRNTIFPGTVAPQVNAGNSISSTNRVANAVVEENIISVRSTLSSAPSGFIFDDVDNAVFVANWVDTAATRPALDIRDSEVEVVNNRLISDRSRLIDIENLNNATSSYPIDIRHNTLRFDALGDESLIFIEAKSGSSGTLPLTMWNNIFRNESTQADTGQCPFFSNRAVTAIDYNLYDNFILGCPKGVASVGSNAVIGPASLNSNLNITTGSAAIDSGTNANSYATDFEGDARPQGATVDIGADEL